MKLQLINFAKKNKNINLIYLALLKAERLSEANKSRHGSCVWLPTS